MIKNPHAQEKRKLLSQILFYISLSKHHGFTWIVYVKIAGKEVGSCQVFSSAVLVWLADARIEAKVVSENWYTGE